MWGNGLSLVAVDDFKLVWFSKEKMSQIQISLAAEQPYAITRWCSLHQS